MTAFDAEGSFAINNAAAPATNAAEADVPLIVVVPPPTASVVIPTPGAAMNVSAPELLELHSKSDESVADTPITSASPAGYVGVDTPSFPVDATNTTPF